MEVVNDKRRLLNIIPDISTLVKTGHFYFGLTGGPLGKNGINRQTGGPA